jgi:predicted AlkP superfamily phosphohydrolase/phosphomutase
MYTATSPARHGVHYLLQLIPGTYRLQYVADAEFVRRPAFWEALSRAGRRVAVLDVPLSRLAADLSGVQVVEWGGHDSVYGFRALPDELAADLSARHGTHPLGGACDRSGRTPAQFAEFVGQLEEGVRRKAAWTSELLARGGWDLFMQVFTESHCAGHQCWHLHDPAHPAHDPAFVREHGDPLERVYRAIDAAIGQILRDAGDAHVMVFTAHGMSHRFGAQFLLRDILVRLGVTVPEPSAQGRASLLNMAARWGWDRLPEFVRGSIRALRRRSAAAAPKQARTPSLRIDAVRSACFPINNGLAVGGIRLNLAGREPTGRLQPGPEADAFCRRLTEDLLAIVDDLTGRALISSVVRTSELYAGEHLGALPDLLVEWSDETPLGSTTLGPAEAGRVRAGSQAIGIIEGANDYARTGEHRAGGWLVAAGPGIRPGDLGRAVSLLDVAPTAGALLGVPLQEVDGRPIAELLGRGAGARQADAGPA